jgi:uridine phosphorylase
LASDPRDRKGALYHIGLKKSDAGRIALLPGDPDRVPRLAERLEKARELASHREFRSYSGYVGKERVVVMSTGIGGPSTAICVEELARLGVKVMVRVGTCGAIRPDIPIGSLVIAEAAVRMEGTSHQYVPEGYPAAASPEVTLALKEEARALGVSSFLGIAASTDSFYTGQGRKSYGGYFPSDKTSLIDDLRSANVLAFEMESAALFTLTRVFGIKSGAVFAVVANRSTDEFRSGAGEDEAVSVAVGAVRRFSAFGV